MSIKSSPLDWLSFPPSSPGDVHAPHPDLFDLELDSSIIALPQDDQEQLQLLNIELNDPYAFVRSDTPRCGPPSTFTVSSESTYDSYSSHSESLYNFSTSPSAYNSNGEYPADLGIDFSRISVDVDAAAAEAKVQLRASGNIKEEPDTLALIPKIDESTLDVPNNVFGAAFGRRDRSRRASYQHGLTAAAAASVSTPQSSVEFLTSAMYPNKPSAAAQSTISPANLLSTAPLTGQSMDRSTSSPTPSSTNSHSSISSGPPTASLHEMTEPRDPRKKYKCTSCPRAFARAYNLKTHLQTHDPNRLKPHTCPYKSCGRSFSRKHDLGRHLVSIHRDDEVVSESKTIGVSQGARGWCDDCGAGWVGKQPVCTCHNIK